MVFVSLEGFLEGGADLHGKDGNASIASTTVPVPHAQQLPQAPVHVVVTPGSPVKPSAVAPSNSGQKRSRLRRATAAFSSFATTKNSSPTDVTAVVPPPPLAEQFVVYVTDRDVHHKWVLAKAPSDYVALQKSLQAVVAASSCQQFACCGPLRRIVGSSQYKKPKRRWNDSRLATHFVRCNVMQEFLNDLLLAVLRRDHECGATRLAWDALSAFLDVENQRSEVADKIVLHTVGEHPARRASQSLRRSISEQLPPRRTSIVVEQDPVTVFDDCDHVHHTEGEDDDSEPESSDDLECPICCCALYGEQAAGKTSRLLCGHKYHAECVRVWLRMHHTCPVCRIPIERM